MSRESHSKTNRLCFKGCTKDKILFKYKDLIRLIGTKSFVAIMKLY